MNNKAKAIDTDNKTSRRGFLKTAAGGTTGWLILGDSRSARSYQANEKLNIALVGVGRRGKYHAGAIPRTGQNLAVLCDVDRRRTAEVSKKWPRVPTYQDFRKMLDEMDRQIDAVVVATTTNTHAVISAAAMKRGKHVYCEKPMALDVAEARALRQIAKQQKVATQQGNQGMATDSFRRTLELVMDGAVGEICEAHVWFVHGGSGPRQRPKEKPPVPDYLDWDLWLGPAPFRPYHPAYVSAAWASWREYGTGNLGGNGAHAINMVFKALRLRQLWDGPGGPKGLIRVEPHPAEHCTETFPSWQTIHFDIPQRGPLPPARINWYNAPEPKLKQLGVWQRLEKIAGRSVEWKKRWKKSWTPLSGSLVVGAKGVVHTNAHNSMCVLLPEKDFPDSGGPPRSLPRAGSHEREWQQACKGRLTPLSNFDYSGPAIELLLLGNVATLVNRPIEYDPVACKIAGDEEADRALRRQYREGWSLPSFP